MNHTLRNDTVLNELAIKALLARMQPIAPYLVVAEVVLLFISLFTAAMFGFILWQTKTFHVNLRMLFLSLVLATYGYVISRYVISCFEHKMFLDWQ
jgi:type III secretory pathway component EscS